MTACLRIEKFNKRPVNTSSY